MRTYSVAVAALAASAPKKWVDNVISRHPLPDVSPAGTQGVARRIAFQGLVRLALVHRLNNGLGLSVDRAVAIAAEMLSAEGKGVFRYGQLELSLDRIQLERELALRLQDVLESAPSPRRGRPHKRTRR